MDTQGRINSLLTERVQVVLFDDPARPDKNARHMEEMPARVRGETLLSRQVLLGDGDDVYGSLRCLVYYVLLPALFTLALLAAAGAWWLVGRLP